MYFVATICPRVVNVHRESSEQELEAWTRQNHAFVARTVDHHPERACISQIRRVGMNRKSEKADTIPFPFKIGYRYLIFTETRNRQYSAEQQAATKSWFRWLIPPATNVVFGLKCIENYDSFAVERGICGKTIVLCEIEDTCRVAAFKCKQKLTHVSLSSERDLMRSKVGACRFLSPKSHVERSIFVFSSIIDFRTCDTAIACLNEPQAKLESECWEPSRNVFCKYLNTKKHADRDESDVISYLDSQFFHGIQTVISGIRSINSHFRTTKDSGYCIRKIFGPTRAHKDGMMPNKSNDCPRTCAVIIALNDDYEGGELCFPYQDVIIKLGKGEAIVFPPDSPHVHYNRDLRNMSYRYTMNTWLLTDS